MTEQRPALFASAEIRVTSVPIAEAVPREVFNQSTHILVFRCAGNPVRLLKDRNYCVGGVEKIIPQLPGDELPPKQRGYFVLLERGRPWTTVPR